MSCSVGPQLLCRGGVGLAAAPTSQISMLLALAWLQPPLIQALQQIPLCTSQQGLPSPLLALCLPSWPGAMLEGGQHCWQQSRVRRGGSVQSTQGDHLMGLVHLFNDGVHHGFIAPPQQPVLSTQQRNAIVHMVQGDQMH